MPLEVLGGSQVASFEFDTTGLEKDVRDAIEKSVQYAKRFETALQSAADNGVGAFKDAINQALIEAEKIAPLIEKGISGLDGNKLKKFNDELANSTDQFDELNRVVDFLEENMSDLSLNPEELTQLQESLQSITATFDGMSDKQRSMLTQLRNLKEAIAQGPEGNPFFEQMVEDATELQERLKRVQQELKISSSNAPGIVATTQAVRGLVGGFAALQGVLALVSDNNEQLEGTIKTLVATMSVLQGIQQVSEVLDKNSALNVFLTAQYRKLAATATTEQAVATGVLTGATTAQAAATTAAAAAQTGLNTAMKLNPAGLLIAGLTAVVGAIQFFAKSTENAELRVKRFNTELQKIGRASSAMIDRIRFIQQLNQQSIRERGGLESEATNSAIEGYKQEAAAYKKMIDEKELKVREFFGTYYNLSNPDVAESNLQSIEAGLLDPKLDKTRRQKLEAIRDTIKEVVQLYNDISEAEQSLQLTQDKLLTERREEALRSAQASADARLLLVKRNTEEELRLEIAAIKARTRAELNSGNITTGERSLIIARQEKEIEEARQRFQQLQLNNQREVIQAQLAMVRQGTAEELEYRIALIKKSAELELAEAELTDAQIFRIKSEAAKEISDLTQKFNQETTEAEIEAVISGTKARLSAVMEGTHEELELRKKLIEDETQLEVFRAKATINNETLLQARITEIFAASLASRRKLEEDYVNNFLQKQFANLDRKLQKANDPLQQVLSDTRSSGNEKYRAQLKMLQNELTNLKRKQREVGDQILSGKGNIDQLTNSFDDLQAAIDKVNSESKTLTEGKFANEMRNLAADLSKMSSAFGGLANTLQDVNPELAQVFQNLSDIQSIASDVISSFASFSAGDPVSGISSAIKAVEGIIAGFAKAKQSAKDAKQAVLDFQAQLIAGEIEYNALLRERQRQQITLNKLTVTGLEDQKKLLLDQKKINQDIFNDLLKKLQAESFIAGQKTKKKRGSLLGGLAGFFSGTRTSVVDELQSLAGKSFEDIEKLFLSGQLTDRAKELFQQLQAIKQEGVDIDALLAENTRQLREALTGTTAESITDSIVEGFKAGKREAADFADNFKELMQNALLQSLKLRFLEGPLQDFFAEFASLSDSGGQLTQGEINQLQTLYNNIIQNAASQFEQLQQIAGLNIAGQGSQANSLSGAIRGITEQQADLLAGQFGGLRITALEQLNVARNQLIAQQKIEINTALSYQRLAAIYDKLIYYYETVGVKIR